MIDTKKIPGFWLIVVALVVVLLVLEVAYGSGDDRSGTDVDVANSIAVGGSDTVALSSSLGDVDIGDCLASSQISILIVFQRQVVKENPWCQAMYLDAIGSYDAAAKVRCSTKTMQKIYPDPLACEAAVLIVPPAPPPVVEDEGIEEQWRAEQMQMQQDYEARIVKLEARARRPVQTRVVQEVVQQPLLNADKKARLQAILDEDK